MALRFKAFNDDVWDAFGEAAAEVFEETREPLRSCYTKIDDSFQAGLREIGGMLAEGVRGWTFVNQRNRVLGPLSKLCACVFVSHDLSNCRGRDFPAVSA